MTDVLSLRGRQRNEEDGQSGIISHPMGQRSPRTGLSAPARRSLLDITAIA